jgi:8-oxo-dGTP pyrophosphatase MutT (NUDIX family)
MSEIVIYYKERKILLRSVGIGSNRSCDEGTIRHQSIDETKEILNTFIESEDINEIVFEHEQLMLLFEDFKSLFTYIEASGGLVRNEKNELLVIHRFGRPDLPKGKIEAGEKPGDAAKREVEEECGIKGHEIVKEVEPSYHIYHIGKEKILKKTYWFVMQYKGNDRLVPQSKESIVGVEWCDEEKIEAYKEYSYASIRKYFK